MQGQIQENKTASENIPLLTFFTIETPRQIKIILLKMCFDDRHKIYWIQLKVFCAGFAQNSGSSYSTCQTLKMSKSKAFPDGMIALGSYRLVLCKFGIF